MSGGQPHTIVAVYSGDTIATADVIDMVADPAKARYVEHLQRDYNENRRQPPVDIPFPEPVPVGGFIAIYRSRAIPTAEDGGRRRAPRSLERVVTEPEVVRTYVERRIREEKKRVHIIRSAASRAKVHGTIDALQAVLDAADGDR